MWPRPGILARPHEISTIEPSKDGLWSAFGARGQLYRFCKNRELGVCNWMLLANTAEEFCAACRHNHMIPDLSRPENLELWRKLETAKHRLFYTLLHLRLPLANRTDDPIHGLAFDFLSEDSQPHAQRIMTGHANGTITVAAKEADDVERERVRTQMGEPYRTLLGHFRHESGHYFWEILVRDTPSMDSFRVTFGDETNYETALQTYHAHGAPADWQQCFVSAYASAHSWEDFAETWAHYLHIVDTLETAQSFGVKVQARVARPSERMAVVIDFDPHRAPSTDHLIKAWLPLCFAVNSMNRSMGQADLYPFVLSPTAIGKLDYIHRLIQRPLSSIPVDAARASSQASIALDSP